MILTFEIGMLVGVFISIFAFWVSEIIMKKATSDAYVSEGEQNE